jgi:DNA-binding NtrC family response regulator
MNKIIKHIDKTLGKLRILMINHEDSHLKLYKEALTTNKVKITTCTDKAKALAILKKDNAFDFVILDDATDMLSDIREAGLLLPVIVISDFDEIEEVRTIYERGCLNVLLKSQSQEAMVAALKETLAGKKDRYTNEAKTYLAMMDQKLDAVINPI